MQELYAKKTYIELNIEQLKKNIKEIEKDFQYALELDEVVICPTCGARYTNDILSRHELMKDEHVCRDMVIRCNNDLDIVFSFVRIMSLLLFVQTYPTNMEVLTASYNTQLSHN